MQKSESIIELSKALASFQKEVKQPMKDADNPFFKSKYVPLESVVEAITACAPKHGLSFLQYPCNNEDGRIGIATVITHESGEYMEFDPVFMRPEKDTPQGLGSVLTYLRRYALSAIFGITSDQDDDGNQASGNNKPPKQPDPLNGDITTKFSEALQVVGGKETLYKKLNTNKDAISKLLNSKKKAEKQKLLKQLEGIIHDNQQAG